MVSSSTSALLRLAGWSYIPDIITKQLLSITHNTVFPRLGRTAPPPRTQRWVTHYRYMFSIVVTGYLLYNLVEALRTTPPNFYEILGVRPTADDDALKVAFRQFARRNHPDRVGSGGEALFIHVREVYDALKDPTTRFAYDRFGPDVVQWQHLSTVREYLNRGLLQSVGFYIASGVMLLAFSALGQSSPVAFWRYLLFVTLFATEMSLVLSADRQTLGILGLLFPSRVIHQHVLFLHQVFMFLSVAVTRVVPTLIPGLFMPDPNKLYAPFVQKLVAITSTLDREMTRALRIDLHAMHGDPLERINPDEPYHPSSEVIDLLTDEMENLLLESRLRAQTPLQSLWNFAVERGRRREKMDKKQEADGALPSPPDDQPGGRGRLPSPRPSPPPLPLAGMVVGSSTRREGYVRARSVSWSGC